MEYKDAYRKSGMTELKRRLGWKEATALGIGAMVGAGIFVLSGVAVGKAGPAVMISFVLAAILEILLGLLIPVGGSGILTGVFWLLLGCGLYAIRLPSLR
ncbi:hypothetical protein LSG31_19550 [Fodinisporobacter ferrooxydans]|uniref:Amino acid permease n=1 Tax=Fodinisporobacter ferrooxydans TaxID=2901836 RepID=A0ABY4CHU1_9BACL|nr:hypothetical protein LSG31_19550 [Alicyclobacillaceae bacterium MYW30-H2]